MLVDEPDRFLMQKQLELEAFYSIGEALSVVRPDRRGCWEEDLLGNTFEDVSDSYVERGEMWLYSEDIARLAA